MVVLHGLGDSAEGYVWLPQAMRMPWLNYLLVNAPDDYYGGFSWFDISPTLEADPKGIARSRKLLFELLDHTRTLGYASENTFLFGFSQGCLMTWETGLRYPARLAGLLGISGWCQHHQQALTEAVPTAREQRFLITHGTLDPLLPFDKVQAQVKDLQAAGLNIQWHELPKDHTILGETEMRLIRAFVEE